MVSRLDRFHGKNNRAKPFSSRGYWRNTARSRNQPAGSRPRPDGAALNQSRFALSKAQWRALCYFRRPGLLAPAGDALLTQADGLADSLEEDAQHAFAAG